MQLEEKKMCVVWYLTLENFDDRLLVHLNSKIVKYYPII